jgi:signal transduction histidine kinase
MFPSFQFSINNGYIMGVEDSLVQAKKLKNFLDTNGLNNRLFSNAEDALEALRNDPPVLIISDIVMPGKDGYALCTEVKADPGLREIPVILLTSLRDPLDIIKGLQAGADNFITKPYEEDYLLSRIQYLLANKDMRKAGGGEMVMQIMFRGNKYFINSDKKQILDLLLSVYEAAVQRNDQLITTQQELQASNENLTSAYQELEAFSYTVSHDLRSPLNVVAGYTQLLTEEYGHLMDDEGRDYLQKILNSAFSMAKLIDDLLKFSRSGRSPINKQPVDLSEMASSIVRDIRERTSGFRAQIIVQPGLSADADPDLTHVVLDNLIGNAVKYSSKKERPEIVIGKTDEGRDSAFFIRDNGAGFDMAKADKMFNPFQRFHTSHEFQGTGVGLATVKRIIERHGGSIWAESEVGEGTTFWFTFGS